MYSKISSSILVLFLIFRILPGATESRPNILLILSDDHSFPHAGCYGSANCLSNNITPNIDALASEGMRFDRAYTTAPQCAPSRISMFAGQSPVRLGVTRFAEPPRSDVTFFTDVLRLNGYWVGLDGRHQHLDGRKRDAEYITEVLRAEGMRSLDKRFDHFVRAASTKGVDLEKVPQLVGAALDKVPAGKPFFLYFGFSQPHRSFGLDHEGINPNKLELPPDWPDLPEVRLDYARFLDEVRDLDTGIGLIMQLLEKRNLEDNTLVIFMGDNGEALLRGKGTLNVRGIHVPLIIRWPGKVKPGTTSQSLVSGVDLAATILEAAGLEAPPEMRSVSFLPALLGKPFTGRKYIFAERSWHFGPITRTDGLDLSRSVISDRFLLIYNALPGRSYTPVDMPDNEAWLQVQAAHDAGKLSPIHERLYFQNPRPIMELYDLINDPFGLNNLFGNPALQDTETKLREELEKWMIRDHDYLPLPIHALQNAKRWEQTK